MIPRHSFVAPPAGANAAATASAGDERGEERPHTSLRNQTPESTAPASMKTSPPPAATDVTSTSLRRARRASRARRTSTSGRADCAPAMNCPPLVRAIDCSTVGLDRNLDPLGEAALDRLLDDAVGRPDRDGVTGMCALRAPVAPPAAASRAPPSGRRRRRPRRQPAAAWRPASPALRARPRRHERPRRRAPFPADPCGRARAPRAPRSRSWVGGDASVVWSEKVITDIR